MMHQHKTTTKTLTEAHTGSLRQLQRKLNCGVSIGTLSRVLNGQPVSLQAENRIRLALGLAPLRISRKRIRREMTPAQAAAWDRLTMEERDRVLGVKPFTNWD